MSFPVLPDMPATKFIRQVFPLWNMPARHTMLNWITKSDQSCPFDFIYELHTLQPHMEKKKGGGCFATGTEMQKSRSSVERNGDGVSLMVKENLVQFSN